MTRALILAFLLIAGLSPATAEPRSLKDGYADGPAYYDVTTAHGCYYHRGRQFCSRYCYVERNGIRYCQRRAREAHPQAGEWIEEVYPRRTQW